MRTATALHLPQPCAESWDAMTPTAGGRHCAACQKAVIDFTQQTDAQVLAYFRQARSGQTCGRFRTEQLGRALREPAPANRWRAWLALALAAGGTQAATAAPPPAPVTTQHAPRRVADRPHPTWRAPRYVQGTVRDSVSGEPLAGVAVFLRGENRHAITDANGWFGLRLSPRRPQGGRALVLHYTDYVSETVRLPLTRRPVTRLSLRLRFDPVAAAGATVAGQQVSYRRDITGGSVQTIQVEEHTAHLRQPWPWHPRSFYYWMTRPFRRARRTDLP